MKVKILLFTFIILSATCFAGNEVYVCTGKYAKAYHKTEDCKGIKSCKAAVKKVTLEKAKNMKRTACKYCYKN